MTRDGRVLLAADYVQCEVRILAHFAKDSKVCMYFYGYICVHVFVHVCVPGAKMFVLIPLKIPGYVSTFMDTYVYMCFYMCLCMDVHVAKVSKICM
jgi:hypothetical protein